jgi:hypothetical protein
LDELTPYSKTQRDIMKQNFILVQSNKESDAEKKFWHRVKILKKVLKDAVHEDMKIMWKWKLISLMKKCEFNK